MHKDVSIHLCLFFVPCHSLSAQGISSDACEGDFGGSVNCLRCLPPRDITTLAPPSWQTLLNAFELSPFTISKKFQTQLLRDWAIALSCRKK